MIAFPYQHSMIAKKQNKVCKRLVHQLHYIDGFSELVSIHGKTCLAGNSHSISKRHNTAMGADKLTHRALPWRPAATLHYLKRKTTLPFVLRLAA